MIWWLLAVLLAAVVFLIWLYPAIRLLFSLGPRSAGDLPPEKTTRTGCRVLIFPTTKPAHATLVVIPGLHPQGIRDPRFQSFAAGCSTAGFQVVAVDVEEYRSFRLTGESLQQISDIVRELPDLVAPGSLANLGLLGISFGAGGIFACAAEEDLKNRIHFLVAVGGFYSLIPALRFAVSGARFPGMMQRPVQPWGRLILAYQQIEHLSDPADLPLLRRILELHLNMHETEAAQLEQQLSPTTRAVLSEIISGTSESGKTRLEELLSTYEDVSRRISPAFLADRLSPRLCVYLVHGRNDDLLPFEETEDLERALRQKMTVRTLITDSLTHVDPVHPWRGLWSWFRLALWARGLLREASLHS